MTEWMHPVVPLVVAALIVPFLGPVGRRILSVAAPLAALAILALLPIGTQQTIRVMGLDLMVLKIDAMAQVFAFAFAGYGVIAAVYAWREESKVAKPTSLILVAGGLGTVLAGDMLVLFVFWEWLTVASLFLIWGGNSEKARAAGFRYLLFHVGGAVFLLAGIVAHAHQNGGDFSVQALSVGLPMVLVAIGLLTNAAVPPLHAWLPDAYPEASIYGSVFLSAFTTKAAVYVLARTLPGVEVLAWLGATMTLYGVVFATLENNIRRLLGYHIISQVGYMVAGVGMGTALALNGTGAHAFSHIFYKGLLMMSVGTVIYATGCARLTELGGLARSMKLTVVFCLIGGFSIAGVPFFNGFVSKSMIVSAAIYANMPTIELMLLVASMGTFLSIGLKLPWFMFADRPKLAKVQREVPVSMYVAMGLAATVCIATGIFPGLLYQLLPHEMSYVPYTIDHVVQALQLLIGTALVFWILRLKLGGQPTITLDVDRLYRSTLYRVSAGIGEGFLALGGQVKKFNAVWIESGSQLLRYYNAVNQRLILANQAAIIVTCLALLGMALIILAG